VRAVDKYQELAARSSSIFTATQLLHAVSETRECPQPRASQRQANIRLQPSSASATLSRRG
jgi:hypothetical protein